MKRIDHTPIFHDFSIFASPPITVSHIDTFIIWRDTHEWSNMNTSNHRPATEEGIIAITGFALSSNPSNTFTCPITPAFEGLLKGHLKSFESILSDIRAETAGSVPDHLVIPVWAPSTIRGCEFHKHCLYQVCGSARLQRVRS